MTPDQALALLALITNLQVAVMTKDQQLAALTAEVETLRRAAGDVVLDQLAADLGLSGE